MSEEKNFDAAFNENIKNGNFVDLGNGRYRLSELGERRIQMKIPKTLKWAEKKKRQGITVSPADFFARAKKEYPSL